MKPIYLPQEVWTNTWLGLRERSMSEKESLCVWAGVRQDNYSRVEEIIFLDDLPGVESFALFHRVPRPAVKQLFKILLDKKLEFIADVHTHPEDWVGLSLTDQSHPIEFRIGFVSVVLPFYAASEPMLTKVGVHEYVGESQWRTYINDEISEKLKIGGI